MKTISINIFMILIGAIIGTITTSYFWAQKKQKWMLAVELDRVTYSYAPLKSLENGNTKEAQHLLLSHLDDALIHYEKAASRVTGWDGTNVALIRGARELYAAIINKNSEQGAGGYGSPAAGSPYPQP
ncbi:MAG: hypothetical protein M9963_00855 [Kiritimatiellae bacterium]|nr:hypothetical protein [Kiritimatiellia bacterium]MCO5060543.1 hypothetical protein [Kiritimatiellia bacterium]